MAAAADIAIIGAGIAGCAAALALADSGLSVVSIAPPRDDRDRIGEFLSPAGNAILRDLGLAETFAAGPHREANATYASWGSELLAPRNAIVHVEGSGHVLDRSAFERMLRDAVGCAAVEASVTDAAFDDGRWSLLLSDGSTLTARFVLDCSGRASVLGKRRRVDRLVAAYGFLRQYDNDVEPTPATLIEAVASGWWYASLLPDRRLSLAFFADPDTMPRRISHDVSVWIGHIEQTRFIRQWLESACYRIETPPVLTSAGTTWMDPPAGPRWTAAGDSAAAFDPLSSHGLTSALWSGRRAALAAAADLGGDPEPLARYAATVQGAVKDFLTQRRGVYAAEHRWLEQPFWRRRI